jgi:hypothetical protein
VRPSSSHFISLGLSVFLGEHGGAQTRVKGGVGYLDAVDKKLREILKSIIVYGIFQPYPTPLY